MPESHLWLINHLGSTFKLGTNHRKFRQLENTLDDAVNIKRLSASRWCAWAIGHDHRVYIYVHSSDVPIRVPEITFENQRWSPIHKFSKKGLIKTDRPAWSNEAGTVYRPKESVRRPSSHWNWDGDWFIDDNLRGEVVGIEGWQYAFDFPAVYTPEKHWNSFVRKRKWIRFRRFSPTDIWARISDMEVVERAECFIDVSVGGFLMPSQPAGFLSVWAVTNNGHVYVRTDVNHDNPEGSTWQELPISDNTGIINISVGASNLVWAVTWDGNTLVRTHVTRNNIYGSGWVVVEHPDNSTRFMQVSVGRNSVWAISREGKVWFRKGTSGDDMFWNHSSASGTSWVEMVGEMSHIAVSSNDQVFAIDLAGKNICFRTGVTAADSTGKTWQPISLHEDLSVLQKEGLLSEGEVCSCGDPDFPCAVHIEPRQRLSSTTTTCSSMSAATFVEENCDSPIFPHQTFPIHVTEQFPGFDSLSFWKQKQFMTSQTDITNSPQADTRSNGALPSLDGGYSSCPIMTTDYNDTVNEEKQKQSCDCHTITQPNSQTSITQPNSQTSITQPNSQTSITQPNSQTSALSQHLSDEEEIQYSQHTKTAFSSRTTAENFRATESLNEGTVPSAETPGDFIPAVLRLTSRDKLDHTHAVVDNSTDNPHALMKRELPANLYESVERPNSEKNVIASFDSKCVIEDIPEQEIFIIPLVNVNVGSVRLLKSESNTLSAEVASSDHCLSESDTICESADQSSKPCVSDHSKTFISHGSFSNNELTFSRSNQLHTSAAFNDLFTMNNNPDISKLDNRSTASDVVFAMDKTPGIKNPDGGLYTSPTSDDDVFSIKSSPDVHKSFKFNHEIVLDHNIKNKLNGDISRFSLEDEFSPAVCNTSINNGESSDLVHTLNHVHDPEQVRNKKKYKERRRKKIDLSCNGTNNDSVVFKTFRTRRKRRGKLANTMNGNSEKTDTASISSDTSCTFPEAETIIDDINISPESPENKTYVDSVDGNHIYPHHVDYPGYKSLSSEVSDSHSFPNFSSFSGDYFNPIGFDADLAVTMLVNSDATTSQHIYPQTPKTVITKVNITEHKKDSLKPTPGTYGNGSPKSESTRNSPKSVVHAGSGRNSPKPAVFAGSSRNSPKPDVHAESGKYGQIPAAYAGNDQNCPNPAVFADSGRNSAKPAVYSWSGRNSPKPAVYSWSGRNSPQPAVVAGSGRNSPYPAVFAGSGRNSPNPAVFAGSGQNIPKLVVHTGSDRNSPIPVDAESNSNSSKPVGIPDNLQLSSMLENKLQSSELNICGDTPDETLKHLLPQDTVRNGADGVVNYSDSQGKIFHENCEIISNEDVSVSLSKSNIIVENMSISDSKHREGCVIPAGETVTEHSGKIWSDDDDDTVEDCDSSVTPRNGLAERSESTDSSIITRQQLFEEFFNNKSNSLDSASNSGEILDFVNDYPVSGDECLEKKDSTCSENEVHHEFRCCPEEHEIGDLNQGQPTYDSLSTLKSNFPSQVSVNSSRSSASSLSNGMRDFAEDSDQPDIENSMQASAQPTCRSSQSNSTDNHPISLPLATLTPVKKVPRYLKSPHPTHVPVDNIIPFAALTMSQPRLSWKWLDATSCIIEDPSTVEWLSNISKESEPKKKIVKIAKELRQDIMKQLQERNKREVHKFKDIKQAVKRTTWVKKASMQMYLYSRKSHWVSCNVELEQGIGNHSEGSLTVHYHHRGKQKNTQIPLSEITCVKTSSDVDTPSGFVIYTPATNIIHQPLTLKANSENEASDWIGCLSAANAAAWNMKCPEAPGAIWSCTFIGDVFVNSSSSMTKHPSELCWGQHGGHTRLIETGPSGVTWALGFDRMPYFYNGGYGGAVLNGNSEMSDNTHQIVDHHKVFVYENQTWFPGPGWCCKGVFHNDFNWLTESNRSVKSKEEVNMPSSKCQWVSDWTVDFSTSGGVDTNGWQYSSSLYGPFLPRQFLRSSYRRRRWFRQYKIIVFGPWQAAGSLGLVDLSVQIDPVNSTSDPVVLWAVGANGDVLCRNGVTASYPKGQSWIHVATYLDKPFKSISVGGNYRVWGIAGDGSAYFRPGVSPHNQTGTCWLQVVPPPPGNFLLHQVSAGATSVWAVDTGDNLWRRENITPTFPEGTGWELVASRVKRVSVGPKDQVWIVADALFAKMKHGPGVIYNRVGITSAKPAGTDWEVVIGSGWAHVSVRGVSEVKHEDHSADLEDESSI